MKGGFRTQTIRDAEYGPDTLTELARTSEQRARERRALATIHELAEAVLAGDAETIDRIQAEVRGDGR